MKRFEITAQLVRKLVGIVDKGLVCGLGDPEPGKMCVEAAVCFALGQDHGDDPKCVSKEVAGVKIQLNDCHWSDDRARGRGLRRVAVAQLGSKGVVTAFAFYRAMIHEIYFSDLVPAVIRAMLKSDHLSMDREDRNTLKSIKDALVNATNIKQAKNAVTKLDDWSSAKFWAGSYDLANLCDLIQAVNQLRHAKTIYEKRDRIYNVIDQASVIDGIDSNRYKRIMANVIEEALWNCDSPGCDFLHIVRR